MAGRSGSYKPFQQSNVDFNERNHEYNNQRNDLYKEPNNLPHMKELNLDKLNSQQTNFSKFTQN